MKACLDTHAVIWSLMDDSRLGTHAKLLIQESSKADLIVPDIVLLETSMLIAKGRLQTKHSPMVTLEAIASHFTMMAITPDIAHLSTTLDLPHGDPFDRVIAATAIHHRVPLLTRDKALTRSGVTEVVW